METNNKRPNKPWNKIKDTVKSFNTLMSFIKHLKWLGERIHPLVFIEVLKIINDLIN